MGRRVYVPKMYWLIVIPALAVTGKLMRYFLMPMLIRGSIGNLVIQAVQGRMYEDRALMLVSRMFSFIQWTKIYSLGFWEVIITFIFNILFLYMMLRIKNFNLFQFLIVNANCLFLNIYAYNVGKEIVQYVLFLVIYFIMKSDVRIGEKYSLVVAVVILEAAFFRTYYVFLIFFFLTGFFFKLTTERLKIQKCFSAYLALMLISYLVMLSFSNLLLHDMYQALATTREILLVNPANAHTNILNLLPINAPFLVWLNYCINLVRTSFPVEILLISLKYTPFVAYQFFVNFFVIQNRQKLMYENFIWFSFWASFVMMSVTFEPEYGSLLRHQSVVWMFLFQFMGSYSEHKHKEFMGKFGCLALLFRRKVLKRI